MQMRLGKSWVALLFCLTHSKLRTLIVCPAKVLPSWIHECSLDGVTPLIFAGTKSKKTKLREKIPSSKVVIATYESVRNYNLLECGWDFRILDETYRLAKPGSKKSAMMWENHGPEFVIGLSGNPGAETPLDLVSQYIAVDGCIGPYTTPYSFYEDNCEINALGKYQLKRGQDELIRKWMRTQSFCLTREEAGVGGGKEYGRIYCEMPEELRLFYNEVVQDVLFEKTWTVNGKQVKLDPLMRANWLWEMTSGILPGTKAEVKYTHKIDAVVEWVKDRGIRKVVFMSTFVDECQKLTDALIRSGRRVACMTGTTSMARQLEVQKLFDSGELDDVVLQEDAFSMGLNFAASDTLIYLGNSLKGDSRTQSEDRIIHLDKTYDVWIYDVCCRGGADSYVADRMHDKRDLATELVTQGAQYLKEIEKWTENN